MFAERQLRCFIRHKRHWLCIADIAVSQTTVIICVPANVPVREAIATPLYPSCLFRRY